MPDEPLTITAASALLRTGDLTPSELLEQCLRRIDVYEPAVQAWVYLDRERARRDAAEMTDAIRNGDHRGPLHGIPIGVKDIIDVFDMPTGCGSKLWANSYARRDATVVERLRAAGALILGKTVTTPFAFTDPPKTRNPWNLSRTPGGSSSGSAAAVACGMCLAALGTQTGGSLTRPASYCGVCSLKASYGRVSVDGVLPLASSFDHIGVMANSVRDLAVLFEAIAGDDFRDQSISTRSVPECQRRVDKAIASGKLDPRVFIVPTNYFQPLVQPQVAVFLERVIYDIRSLASLDGVCTETVLPLLFNDIHRQHRLIMSVEVAEMHGRRLDRHPDDYPPLIRGLIEDGRRVSAVEYRSARIFRDNSDAQCEFLCRPETLLMPATLDVAPAPGTTGDPWCNSPWSFLGSPTVSVPLGWSDDGMPLAVQFVGVSWHEDSLLETTAFIERAIRDETSLCPQRLPPVPA